jgi:predicted AAA+ superfamily ATPase
MDRYDRILKIDLPRRQSAFLWGPRKTGKTTYLKTKFPKSMVYDFLKTDLFIQFSKQPYLLREQILALPSHILEQPIILDEVQKIPQILDEVHWLIENENLGFILCGSSARKLKRGQVNLLGGRAWRYEMFPLVWPEMGNVDLMKSLNHGLIPSHYLNSNYKKSLKSYVQDYLKEEVFAEGLTRNIPAFSRFFDAMGYSHGQLINYSNIARECGVDSKTVKEYFQILIDTLLGNYVEPFKKRKGRQTIIRAAKFYLFDVGVAGALTNRRIDEEKGQLFGQAFEHFILMQLLAHSSYAGLDYEINFWRTKTGLEVDFILGNGEVAIEVKGSSRVDSKEIKPLQVFCEEYSPRRAILICNEKRGRLHRKILVLPWREFLDELWNGKIIS